MSFVDRLRMNNMFPSPGLGPPKGGNPLEMVDYLMSNVMPLMQYENDQDRQDERRKMDMQGGAIKRIGQPPVESVQKSPNVVLGNQGMTAYQQSQIGIDKQRLAMQQENNNNNALAKNRNADLATERNRISEFKARNPNKRISMTKGGNIMVFDPGTGEFEDSGISSGMLTDAEKAEIQHDNRVEELNIRDDQQNSQIDRRNEGALSRIAAQTAGQQDTQRQRFDLESQRPVKPGEDRVDQNNKARQIVATNPEWSKYLILDEKGGFTIDPNTPTDIANSIRGDIYGVGDIELKPETKAPVKKATTPEKPKSKFAVTIK